MSSAMSAAKAAGDHMRDWWLGTAEGTSVSMGVISDGSYGAPADVIFSYPVTIKNKQWTVVQVSNNFQNVSKTWPESEMSLNINITMLCIGFSN